MSSPRVWPAPMRRGLRAADVFLILGATSAARDRPSEGLAAAAECGRLLCVTLGVERQPIPRGAVSR